MRSLSRALLLGVVCTVALVAPVAAAAPTIERTPVDDTRVFPAGTRCDFEVIGHRTGTLTVKTWSDGSDDRPPDLHVGWRQDRLHEPRQREERHDAPRRAGHLRAERRRHQSR